VQPRRRRRSVPSDGATTERAQQLGHTDPVGQAAGQPVVVVVAVRWLLVVLQVRRAQRQVPELGLSVRCWMEPAGWWAGLTRP